MFCDVERRKKGNRNNKMMVKVIVSSQMAFSSSSSFYAVLPLCMCVRVLQCKGWVLNCRPSIVPRHVIYNICLLLTTIVNPLFVGWTVGDDEYFLSFLSLSLVSFLRLPSAFRPFWHKLFLFGNKEGRLLGVFFERWLIKCSTIFSWAGEFWHPSAKSALSVLLLLLQLWLLLLLVTKLAIIIAMF